MGFEFFIGRRYLRNRKRHAFISLITLLSIAGVTLGVMALIIVIAVMAGFEADLKNRILGVESHVVIMRMGGAFSDYGEVQSMLKENQSVIATTPFIYSQAMLRSAGGMSGAVIRGIDPQTAPQVIRNLDSLTLLRPPDEQAKDSPAHPGIILGKELARSLGVLRGDIVYLISPNGSLGPAGHIPSMKRFQMRGYFESGMHEYDSSLGFIALPEAQKMLRMGDSVTGIELKVDDIYRADRIAKQIQELLGPGYWIRDWMQMNRNLFSALKLEKTAMFIILTLIVLVAAFNIASSLIMMVMQKTKDIAILKAMGAADGSIRRIFVFKGMVIGAIGTFLGVSLGFIACMLLKKYKFIELPGDVYYITKLPVLLNGLDVLMIAVAALVICYLATLYPARQASKLDPVEAIRYG
jgi:lipoprotein-releasing system permease protein